jgi:hypothetical protein
VSALSGCIYLYIFFSAAAGSELQLTSVRRERESGRKGDRKTNFDDALFHINEADQAQKENISTIAGSPLFACFCLLVFVCA